MNAYIQITDSFMLSLRLNGMVLPKFRAGPLTLINLIQIISIKPDLFPWWL